MTPSFPHASVAEGVRFTAQVGLPNVLQGLFKKRELPTRVAGKVRVEAQGFSLVNGLVDKYGPGPFFVRVATDEALLLHRPQDIQFVLEGSPDPFASDPDTKRKGMVAFQPDALTLSRGDVWRNRRAFADAVLQPGGPHPLGDRIVQLAREAADEIVLTGTSTYADINRTFQRLTRRVVLGEAAAGDTDLTHQLGALMAAGNKTPGAPAEGYDAFLAHLQRYVDAPADDALTGLIAGAPHDVGTAVAGQLIHWFFAMGDTLATNVTRALAVLATHAEVRREVQAEAAAADLADAGAVAGLDYTAGVLLESMRLWPTTPLFGRVTAREVTFPGGEVLPADTQVLIYNVFTHRNPAAVPFADRVAPGEWSAGDAAEDWSFNFFSHGPQGCPGASLSVLIGQAVLATIATTHDVMLDGASLSPGSPLSKGLDVNALAFRWTPAG